VISLHEAADRLGVHYMTAYRYVRTGKLPARHERGRWQVRVTDVERLAARPAPKRARRGQPDWARTRARLLTTLTAGDEPGAWALVEAALTAGATPPQVHLELLAPVLRRVGDLWERGELDVGDEHRASVVASRIVARLGPRFRRRGRRSGTVVVAGAPGDHHSLPAALLSDLLRGERFRVIDLGGDTPTGSVLVALSSNPDAGAVCISVSVTDCLPGARRAARSIRRAHPRLTVLVGGPAVDGYEAAIALGSDGFAPDGLAAAALIRELAAPA
jgi:excisionase family DNA binding protein